MTKETAGEDCLFADEKGEWFAPEREAGWNDHKNGSDGHVERKRGLEGPEEGENTELPWRCAGHGGARDPNVGWACLR